MNGNEMRINAIIQARCGSKRFPKKVFAKIEGKPLIWHVINRLRYSEMIDGIVVATTTNPNDDSLESWCRGEDVKCFRGSENDVLNRYYQASLAFPSDIVVRITADDPFKEPRIIDQVIQKLLEGGYDLATNNFPPSFPEGFDCEAFTFSALEKMEKSTKDEFEREHVTQYIYHNPEIFRIGNVSSEIQLSSYRWTIDNEEDYEMVKAIYEKREKNKNGILLMGEILEILNRYPEIVSINSKVKRSAMYQ